MLCLLGHGTNVRAVDSRDNTPLHAVAQRRDLKPKYGVKQLPIVDLLLRWGADNIALNHNDRTPVTGGSCIDAVRILLERAPVDRTWRLRGLLVLCRLFSDRARIELKEETSWASVRAATINSGLWRSRRMKCREMAKGSGSSINHREGRGDTRIMGVRITT